MGLRKKILIFYIMSVMFKGLDFGCDFFPKGYFPKP